MNTYLLSIILFFFILIVLIKYLNIKIDNFSNKNKNKNNNKLNILVHKSIQLSKIETLITLCKLKYGDKCNVCINKNNKNNKNNKCNSRINLIYDNTNTKINDFDSYIIIYNKSNIDLKKDSFYNKYIKNKTNNNKRLIINYNSSYTIDKYIDSILMFIKKINIL